MFRDSLLENSLSTRKRWPVLLAFMLEVLAGAALIAIPLLSSGVIPVSARPTIYSPVMEVKTEQEVEHKPNHTGSKAPTLPIREIVTIANLNPRLPFGRTAPGTKIGTSVEDPPSGNFNAPTNLPVCEKCADATPVAATRLKISVISEGQLIHRVEPTYPRIAVLTAQHGEVRLHAIISRDGSIADLTVVSGPPLLAKAAMDAVAQWRYRPYLLNGQAVEVETTITVNFRRSAN
jgi:protein TonB